MEPKQFPIIVFPLFTSLIWLLAAAVLLAVIIASGLLALDRIDQLPAAMAALGLCALLGAIGFLVMGLLSRVVAHGAAMGFMASTGIRLIGCGSIALLVMARGPDTTFVYWLAAMYLILLMIEVAIVATILSRNMPDPTLHENASREICA